MVTRRVWGQALFTTQRLHYFDRGSDQILAYNRHQAMAGSQIIRNEHVLCMVAVLPKSHFLQEGINFESSVKIFDLSIHHYFQ